MVFHQYSRHNLAITSSEYPERIGYQLIKELHDKNLKSLNSKYLNLGTEVKANDIQFDMVELHRKYNNLSNVDRINAINTEVDDIKIVMKSNVNKMINNIECAEVEYYNTAIKSKESGYF